MKPECLDMWKQQTNFFVNRQNSLNNETLLEDESPQALFPQLAEETPDLANPDSGDVQIDIKDQQESAVMSLPNNESRQESLNKQIDNQIPIPIQQDTPTNVLTLNCLINEDIKQTQLTKQRGRTS